MCPTCCRILSAKATPEPRRSRTFFWAIDRSSMGSSGICGSSRARLDRNDQETSQGASPSDDEAAAGSPEEVRPTPIMLDIPAATLADEDDRVRRSAPNGRTAMRLGGSSHSSVEQREIAWEPETSDDGDIFPTRSENLDRDISTCKEPATKEPEDVAIPDGDAPTELVLVDGGRDTVEAAPTTKCVT